MSYDPNQTPYIPPYSLYDTANTPHLFNSRQPAPLQQGFFPFGQFGGAEQQLNTLLPQLLGMTPAEAQFARFGESRNLIRQQQDFLLQMGRPGASPSGGAAAIDIQRAQQAAITLKQMQLGRQLSAEERMQAQGMGATVMQQMPMVRQLMLGAGVPPQLVKDLTSSVIFGSTGSAVDFNAYSNRVFAGAVDPLTAQRGLDGATRARMGENLFRELTQAGGLREQTRGFDAGELGEIMQGLNARGQLGMSRRGMSLQTQGRTLDGFNEQDFRNVALQTEAGAALVDSAGRVDETELQKVVRNVKQTYNELQKGTREVTASSLSEMTGGRELLDMAEAKRISQTIGKTTEALKAMDELFKENGQTASIPQLMRAVESLTEGASNYISDSQTQGFLRNLQQAASVGGMSLDAANAIRSLGAQTAQQRGGSGFLGSQAAVGAITQINGNNDAFNVRAFGRMNKEETQQALTQMRAAGTASKAAETFQLVAALGGELNAAAGSEAAAFIEAVRAGESSYTFDGQTKSALLSEQQVTSLLQQGGVSRSRIEALRRDKRRLQAAGKDNPENFNQFVANIQREEAIAKVATYSSATSGDVLRDALGNTMQGMTPEEQTKLLFQMSRSAAAAAIDMSTADAANPEIANKMLRQAAANTPGLSPAMRNAILQSATIGDSLMSSLNATTAQLSGQTIEDYRTMHGKEGLQKAELEARRQAVAAAQADAAAGVGTASLAEKVGDLLQKGGVVGVREAFRTVLGGDNAAALAIVDPKGELAGAFGYQADMKKLDPINNAADFEKWKAYSAVTKGLSKGGAAAKEALELAAKAGIALPDATKAKLAEVEHDQSKAGDTLLKSAGINATTIGIRERYAGTGELHEQSNTFVSRGKAFNSIATGENDFTDESAATAADLIAKQQQTLAELEANPDVLDKLTPDQRIAISYGVRNKKFLHGLEKKYGASVSELLTSQRGKLTEDERRHLASAARRANDVAAEFSDLAEYNHYGQQEDAQSAAQIRSQMESQATEIAKDVAKPTPEKPPAKPEDMAAASGGLAGGRVELVGGQITLLVDSTVDASLVGELLAKKA